VSDDALEGEVRELRAELASTREQLERVEALLRTVIRRRPSKRHAPPEARVEGLLTDEQRAEIRKRVGGKRR
jgi:hypothetical protein